MFYLSKYIYRLIQYFLIALFAILSIVGVNAAENASQSAVVFMYHRFGENTLPSTNIKMNQFIQQLDWLEKEGFQVWSLSKIVKHLKQDIAIPDKTVAITIDDAYLSVYTHAYPIFRQRKMPFTVFISSDHVDKRYSNYMNWDQLREMRLNGMEVGNHSSHHRHLIRVSQSYDVWAKHVRKDIKLAETRIEQELGVKPNLFAYPYGEYSMELAKVIDQLGYVGFGQHSGALGSYSDFRFLPRFPMAEAFAEINGFADKANSIEMPVSNVEPRDTVVNDIKAPALDVVVDSTLKIKNRVQCFASGRGAVEVEYPTDNSFRINPGGSFMVRRFRYNCTIPSAQQSRFYWYSHPWINPEYPEL